MLCNWKPSLDDYRVPNISVPAFQSGLKSLLSCAHASCGLAPHFKFLLRTNEQCCIVKELLREIFSLILKSTIKDVIDFQKLPMYARRDIKL
ncbi:hypothetical protein L596_010362 [Steinernema carpocapsae]|uniref:Uncharacterized protein n=1 Tax=Steinernema carpocapsae TaxID=34508 RepID=A0A4U5PI38_STECR|nr:hypothetical protein L596_010362 [Steinernema carpocapsae]